MICPYKDENRCRRGCKGFQCRYREEERETSTGTLARQVKALAAANERIRDLETAVSDWLYANGPDGWIEALRKDVAAEREVSDKLEKAINFALQTFSMSKADNALKSVLAEVAAIRAKQPCQHDWSFDGENAEGTEGHFSCTKCPATHTCSSVKKQPG